MELDPSRVVSATAGISFSDSLKCAICHNVASAPVECAHCQSLFCGPCIQKWIQTSDSCPFRCAATATFQANQPHRVIRAALASLRFTCSHIAQGCQEQIPYEKVDQHEALCAFAPVQCPNDGCQTLVLRKDIQSHALETCEARMLTCCICTLTYPANSRGNHDCIKSLLNDRGILLHTIEELSLRLRESELIIQDLQGKKDAKVMETESTWNCCPKNHQLVFYHDETASCTLCHERNVPSRLRCDVCSETYCFSCKPALMIRQQCPLGHKMKKAAITDKICDICEAPIDGLAYTDSFCNFDICLTCASEFCC